MIFICIWHIYFQLTPAFSSLTLDWHCSALFSPHLKNQIIKPPTLNIWFSNVFHHTKLFAIFAIQPHGGYIKNGNCITLSMFPCCTDKMKSDITASKNGQSHCFLHSLSSLGCQSGGRHQPVIFLPGWHHPRQHQAALFMEVILYCHN